MTKDFRFDSGLNRNELLDQILGKTLKVGVHHGLLPDYSALRDFRRGFKGILKKYIIESANKGEPQNDYYSK